MGGSSPFFLAVLAIAALAGCGKPAAPVETCRVPTLVAHAPPDTYEGARERATICIKLAAYDIAKAGGPVGQVGQAAFARCAGERRGVVAALGKEGPVWPYQTTRLDEDFAHLADLTGVQARAIGCGGAAGSVPGGN